jgi:hypothetical protein
MNFFFSQSGEKRRIKEPLKTGIIKEKKFYITGWGASIFLNIIICIRNICG